MPSNGPITDEQPHTRVRLPADPYASPAARRPRWGSGISVLAVIALVIGAVAFANRGASGPGGGDAAAETPAPPTGQAPSERRAAGVAVGYPHTSAGAESAATNYAVALGSAAMADTRSRRRIVRAIADPAVEPALQARLDASFSRLRESFGLDRDGSAPRGQTFVYRTLPVGTYLAKYTEDTATVEVWTNGIAGLAGRASTRPVVEAWNTITVTVRWVEDDWRWVDFRQKDGPTPISGVQPVSGADEIADAVRKFGGLRYAR
jgi:hypothetical protein